MTTPLTPTPVEVVATVPIPSDAEPANSASIAGFMQPTLNWIAWLSGLLQGGVNQHVDLLNGITAAFGLITGNFRVNGNCLLMAPQLVWKQTAPETTTGVHVYSPSDYSHVVSDNFTASVQSGCVWRLPSPAGHAEGENITFCTLDGSTAVTVQNQAGSTLATLKCDINLMYQVTVILRAGAWVTTMPVYR